MNTRIESVKKEADKSLDKLEECMARLEMKGQWMDPEGQAVTVETDKKHDEQRFSDLETDAAFADDVAVVAPSGARARTTPRCAWACRSTPARASWSRCRTPPPQRTSARSRRPLPRGGRPFLCPASGQNTFAAHFRKFSDRLEPGAAILHLIRSSCRC